jgi:hypothetical protein
MPSAGEYGWFKSRTCVGAYLEFGFASGLPHPFERGQKREAAIGIGRSPMLIQSRLYFLSSNVKCQLLPWWERRL